MRKRTQTGTIHDLSNQEFREVIRRIRSMNETDVLLLELLDEISREMDSAPFQIQPIEDEERAAAP